MMRVIWHSFKMFEQPGVRGKDSNFVFLVIFYQPCHTLMKYGPSKSMFCFHNIYFASVHYSFVPNALIRRVWFMYTLIDNKVESPSHYT